MSYNWSWSWEWEEWFFYPVKVLVISKMFLPFIGMKPRFWWREELLAYEWSCK